MKIIRAKPGHEIILANYFSVNAEHFKAWSPAAPSSHYSVAAWRRRLDEREIEYENEMSVHFIGTDETESYVIGSCSLTNICFGVTMACNLGYSVSKRYEGEGFMQKIVSAAIDYSFNDLKLHRIMANHMPTNVRSAALLKRLGFVREGYACDFLLIDGRWEDHVLNALINPAERGNKHE